MGIYHPNGLSDKAGAHPLLTGFIITSSIVEHVDSVNGSDGYNGSYNRPYATIGGTSPSTGGIVIMKTSSAEVLTAAETPVSGATYIGETSTAGVPDASISMNAAAATCFDMSSVALCQFVNLLFPVMVQSSSEAMIDSAAAGTNLIDCTFRDDVNSDSVTNIDLAGGVHEVRRCTFESTGTTLATAPTSNALRTGDYSRLVDCTFNDGAYGREDNAVDLTTKYRAYGMSLLRGARAEVETSVGVIDVGTATQGGLVDDVDDWYIHSGGISGTNTGDRLLAAVNVYTSSPVYYVSSVTGSDSNDGSFEAPYATLRYAVATRTATYTVFVCLSGHSESVTTTLSLTVEGVTIIGEGDPAGTGVTVDLAATGESNAMSVTGAFVEIRNVKFTSTASGDSTRIHVNAQSVKFDGCRFEVGDSVPKMLQTDTSGTLLQVEDSTFISVGTTRALAPTTALWLSTATSPALLNVTFDGGTYGFTSYAIDGSDGAVPVTRFQGVTLSNGADAKLHANSTGYFQVDADETCSVEAY